ncbi:MAG TPA: hypothetical protein VEX40_06140, partial [Mycobacterium sp.]|nr:hypothetical protein [Mycobacterium sp.]
INSEASVCDGESTLSSASWLIEFSLFRRFLTFAQLTPVPVHDSGELGLQNHTSGTKDPHKAIIFYLRMAG